jgi:hypothetical protein
VAELPVTPALQKYLNVLGQYNREFSKWEARATKIIRRYRDDVRTNGTTGSESARFNILWSNVQTLVPAVFSQLPKASVSRRFADHDPVGRVASLLIERALDYEIEHYPDFRAAMKNGVEDRFLGGRGVAWVRYEPHIVEVEQPEDGWQITEDVDTEGYAEAQEPQEAIEYECAPTDYVHWRDFGHNVARTWEEVTQVWRWVYMSKSALTERFGEELARKIPTNESPEGLTKYGQSSRNSDQAKICELWDRETQKVYWFSESFPEILDERPDPLSLEGFFPCAKPLYATTTTDSLVPIPDYVLYQDQANELDILTDRIDGLVKALRVRGIYDASQPALQRLLTEGDNNTLIPTDKWAAFSEKGGLKGTIDLLPIDAIAATLIQCYQAQQQIKGQIYEITGISDIIRGQTAASETATAQQIKGQYAGLRLRAMQESVALFATDLIRLKAQIICSQFQPETILKYAAADQLSPEDQQMIPQAMQLLTTNPLRNFRIEVAADSLVQLDEQQMKQERIEFIGAFGNFLREAVTAGQQVPELTPMLMKVMQFAIGSFKQARTIEGVIDVALQKLEQKQAEAEQNPQPDPEMMKVQAEQQAAQMKMQSDQQAAQMKIQADSQTQQARVQADMQIEQMKAQMATELQRQKQEFEAQMKVQEMANKEAFERWKAELDAATKIMVARIGANPGSDVPLLESQQQSAGDIAESMKEVMSGISSTYNDMMNMHGQTMERLNGVIENLSAPKRLVRGPDGRAVGVETVRPSIQ